MWTNISSMLYIVFGLRKNSEVNKKRGIERQKQEKKKGRERESKK